MTIKIIDISAWQKPENIDYLKLSTEVDGVILRAAYGTWKDTQFETHYAKLSALGVPVGAYHFIVEYKTASEQAQVFADAVYLKQFQLGYWCDVELENGATRLTRATVDTYVNSLNGRGLSDIGFYTSRYYWDQIMRCNTYKNAKLWIAHYGAVSPLLPATGGWTSWWLWQYTSSGRLSSMGVHDIDHNYFWGGADDYNEWTGQDVSIPNDEPLYEAECIATVAVNIRRDPWVADNVVGTLLNGEKRAVYEERNGWLRIPEGWVSGAYMKRVEVVVPTEPSDAEKLARLWAIHPEAH